MPISEMNTETFVLDFGYHLTGWICLYKNSQVQYLWESL